MNILLFSLSEVISSSDGISKAFSTLANDLSTHGYNVTAIFTDKNTSPFFPYDKQIHLCNLGLRYKWDILTKAKALFSFSLTEKHKIKYYGYGQKLAPKIARIIKKQRPDIIICFQIRAALIIKNILKCDIPTILSCHRPPIEIIEDNKGLNVLENCEAIHALSPCQASAISKEIQCQYIFPIGNIVPQYDNSDFPNYTSKKIINVAKFSTDKNQLLLIEAFNQLAKENPEWTMDIWGSSTVQPVYYKKCLKLIKKYDLTNRIFFCGTTNHILPRLKSASIFAFPSISEALPIALLEAMSIGLPSIGLKDCVGVNELLQNDINGYLCDNTVKSFANQLSILMQNQNLREKLGTNAKKYVKQYSHEKIWQEWDSVLKQLMQRRTHE